MTSITLPRRRLWDNLQVLCEASWDQLRPKPCHDLVYILGAFSRL
jgi:hypothetical protein